MSDLALTAYQLQSMRQTQDSHYPDSVKVERLVRVADSKGGFTTGTPAVIYTDLPCTITPGAEMKAGGQADRGLEMELWTMTCSWGSDVQDDDLLTYAGRQLQVLDAKRDKSNGTALRCNAKIVEGATW